MEVRSSHKPMYSRNLDKALKSILSESPRLARARKEMETMHDLIEVTPSADEDQGSNSIVPVASRDEHEPRNTSSVSISSPSRETSPSSTSMIAGSHIVDIPPFIALFEREREKGRVSKEIREEALKMLRDWRVEWLAEDKRARELKRKIRVKTIAQSESATPRDPQGKARTSTSPIVVQRERSRSASDTPKKVEVQEVVVTSPEATSGSGKRRDSITGTGPNGLTGHYWDIQMDQMGRGARRRTKDAVDIAALAK